MAIGTPGNGLGSRDPNDRNSGNNSIGGGIPARGQGDVYLDQGIENELGACYKNLVNYGLILPAYGLQWRDEVLNFLSSPNTTKIAEFDELSLNVIMDARNSEVASSGQKYKLNCSSYLFKDYCNNITAINYSGVSTYDVSLAKFSFAGLPGEWYVRNGQLCKLEIASTFDGRSPDLGDNPYPHQPPTPPKPAPLLGAGQCYVPLYSDDVIQIEELITEGMWYSSSATATSSLGNSAATIHYHTYETDDYDRMDSACDYILDVYNSNPSTDPCAKIQYKIIYADYNGYGTTDLGGLDSETLTKAMYSQYANILLPKGQEKFIISGSEQDYVYIIDVERSRYNLSMDPGNWELTLTTLTIPNSFANVSSSFDDIMTNSTMDSGSMSTGSFIDSSFGTDVHLTNQSYDVVTGTLELGQVSSNPYIPVGTIIGTFYPNHGIIVLAGSKMQSNFFPTNRTQKRGRNTLRLLRSMNLSAAANPIVDESGDYKGFKARSINKKYNKMYFIRVKNQQLNYSNNPTYQISGSNGTIIEDFNGIEKAFFTTVGLYNQNKELLAVGKVSQATLSSATEETLFTVKVSL